MKLKHILIAGASGAVGEGMTGYFLKQGHTVTAVVRSNSKREALIDALQQENLSIQNLTVIVNAFDNEETIQQLTNALKAVNEIDIVIASLGGWYHGEQLHAIPLADWERVLNNGLSAHFRFAKAVVPILEGQKSGAYVMINGGASEFAVPHSGVVSVGAAAQKMMGQVLQQELREKNIQVYGVAAFDVVRTKQRNNQSHLWLGAEEIAQYILELTLHKEENAYWHRLQQPKDLHLALPAETI